MINFYNYRLAPWTLCKLLHDVVPYRFHMPVVFSYGKRHMPKGNERSLGCAGGRYVHLNLESIAYHGRTGSCSISAGTWRHMLRVGFHEFGHVALRHHRMEDSDHRYKNDYKFKRHIEDQADNKAGEWMGKVLSHDGRLYQPKFLGLADIIRRKRDNSFKISGDWRNIKNARCYVSGGQLSVSDVASNLRISSYEYRCRVINLIHKLADDIARVHVDSAERSHHFWVWGDLPIIAKRLESSNKFERLKKEEEEREENFNNEEIPF